MIINHLRWAKIKFRNGPIIVAESSRQPESPDYRQIIYAKVCAVELSPIGGWVGDIFSIWKT